MLNVLFLAVLALAASSVFALAVPRAPDASNWSASLEVHRVWPGKKIILIFSAGLCNLSCTLPCHWV